MGLRHRQSQKEIRHGIVNKKSKIETSHDLSIRILTLSALTLLFFLIWTFLFMYFLSETNKNFESGHSYRKEQIRKKNENDGNIGDQYQEIRNRFDILYPPETLSTRTSFLDKVRKRNYKPIFSPQTVGVDVFNCPDDPPQNYPTQFPILDILSNWSPDDTTPHTEIYQAICIFQYSTEYDKAMRYREAEVPFVIRDDPEVLQTVERWNKPEYLQTILGDRLHRSEISDNNHFMFWILKNGYPLIPGWKPPTKKLKMSYSDWLSKANFSDVSSIASNKRHWYLRLVGCSSMNKQCNEGQQNLRSDWLFDDLSFFNPSLGENLYLKDPSMQLGIQCKFGMRGIIAENHFDVSRNMIVILGGERRYILSHPKECKNFHLYQKGHPSSRHSAVDWSNPDLSEFPRFANATANEIVLQAGDVLYLPTYWFHYIVSLEMNYQCNTRSGVSNENRITMSRCGFTPVD